ncbi:MAG: alpha/beta hydrolase, partial [Bacteroidia bacterium]|nr:alpha/beta hydrolase [Bacteroidia bacterium]
IVNSAIKACIAFSAPTDLGACSKELEKPSNFIYQRRFLKLLGEKIVIKEQQFPEHISSHKYNQLKTLREFDDRYTAPFFGFKDATDYYEQCSSERYIPSIKIKTLIVTAYNDPFMPDECYPIGICKGHSYVDIEIPEEGGHVGFFQHGNAYWSEKRALEFIESID